jgi:hypothetical protein
MSLLIQQHVSVVIFKTVSREITMRLRGEQKLTLLRSPVALSPIFVI